MGAHRKYPFLEGARFHYRHKVEKSKFTVRRKEMSHWRQDLLREAQRNKKDEFYTQYADIEAELRYYRQAFRGKSVYLNCGDSKESNFYRYFYENFDRLGLKKLTATSYAMSGITKGSDLTYAHSYEVKRISDARIEASSRRLSGDGDFRSGESIQLLKAADIVVTNPPFSLFREFVAKLVEHEKQFLILGNMTAATSKDIFPLFMQDRIWYGKTIRSGDREFAVPDDYPLTAAGARTDVNGSRYVRVKGVRWFTNIEYEGRYENYPLRESFSPERYPEYTNFDAIDVSRTASIPADYPGLMGVPVSFLDKYNPHQFELVGTSRTLSKPIEQFAEKGTYTPGGPRFYLANPDGTHKRLFERIVVRNKRLS